AGSNVDCSDEENALVEVVRTAQAAFSQSLSTALSKFGRAESCETTSAGTERLLREQAIVDANSSQASGQQRDSSALAGLTTVMVKNVPVKYTQRKLLREILNAGFQGKMDFIYLPMDPRNRCARGFAFCNFTTPEAAQQFFRTYHKSHLKSFDSDQPLEVMAAEIQGFEANAEHYLVVKDGMIAMTNTAWKSSLCWQSWHGGRLGIVSLGWRMLEISKASRKEKGRDTLGCPTFLRPLPRQFLNQIRVEEGGADASHVAAASSPSETRP
ncbi:unnamed protein product, partial [Durusdinium trenchii]